jgi:L-threonylcarbamoyladenylate synthase
MHTLHLQASDPHDLARAAAFLRGGQLVVFPTDTVYGVAALVTDAAAIDALYRVKGRPDEKGIPVLLAETAGIELVARDVPSLAQELIERFWPGPLTLILPRRPDLPANLAPGETVAVRVPDDAVARTIIRDAGGAVAATSANRSGDIPARTAEEALAALEGKVAAVVDGGPAEHGISSTIVDCTTDPPAILREGPLTAADLSLPT